MATLNHLRWTSLVALPFLALASAVANAQTTPIPQVPALNPMAARPDELQVRNVRADIMAYWLDPANNPLPGMFARGTGRDGKTPVLPPPVAVKAPAGLERIVPIVPRNRLLVMGTPLAVQQVQDLLKQLDRPLSQFEIETSVVTIKRTALDRLGFDAEVLGTLEKDAKRVVAVAELPTNLRTRLTALVDNGDAKILTAPRLTAIRDLTASLGTSNFAPEDKPAAKNLSTTDHGINFLSTVSEQGEALSLTLDITGTDASKASGAGKVQALSVDTNVHAVAKLEDGDTVALVNVPKSLMRFGDILDRDDDRIFLTLTTVRKIRHLGDDDAVPGAD